jgi:hypothetical protein
MALRTNVFIIVLTITQILMILGYALLTFHDGYGTQQKLDEARQKQKDREDGEWSMLAVCLLYRTEVMQVHLTLGCVQHCENRLRLR